MERRNNRNTSKYFKIDNNALTGQQYDRLCAPDNWRNTKSPRHGKEEREASAFPLMRYALDRTYVVLIDTIFCLFVTAFELNVFVFN